MRWWEVEGLGNFRGEGRSLLGMKVRCSWRRNGREVVVEMWRGKLVGSSMEEVDMRAEAVPGHSVRSGS